MMGRTENFISRMIGKIYTLLVVLRLKLFFSYFTVIINMCLLIKSLDGRCDEFYFHSILKFHKI